MARSNADLAPEVVVAPKIPTASDGFLWKVAAAWADVSVAELLADTAPVKAAHYQAAVRVDKTFDEWLERHDQEAEARAREEAAAGNPLAAEIQDADAVARAMRLAEDVAALTASARDRGDAVTAAKYSSFEHSLLQVAAGLQIAIDIDKVGK